MIKTKSIYSPIEHRKDGLRILAARFRGRGLPTARYDVWMANLGPSEKLLRDAQAGKFNWSEFRRRYTKELFEGDAIEKKTRRSRITGKSSRCGFCRSWPNGER